MNPISSLYDLIQAVRGINATFLTEQHVPSVSLKGKWIVITGSNNGVGFEAAKSFAASGANLILACREPPAWELHPTTAVKECKELAEAQRHESNIEWWEIDMADFESVEAFARRWLDSGRSLDILCNNAGVAAPHARTEKPRLTKDGFQLLHQVRYSSFKKNLIQLVEHTYISRSTCSLRSY
jgi:NAD(P)-dependent dehydrogenase (short-subunit alcohol dehydrogenase family)